MRRLILVIITCISCVIIVAQSDVDTRIAINDKSDPNTFALVISNENYKYEQPVPFALNDGQVFKTYCEKTLGIPEKNIRYVADATLNDMRMQLMWLEKVMKAYGGDARAIIYYSGHGMPSEDGKNAYLLPVDGNSQLSGSGLGTQKLYQDLGVLPSKGIIVFLDACFSGARRDGQMLSSSRGVAIKVKDSPVSGKLVVFSAAKGDETAYPYKEKKHGLFTYYLLSAIQEKGGYISLGELSDYIVKSVSRTSIVENGKSQTPTVLSPVDLSDWRKWMVTDNAAKNYAANDIMFTKSTVSSKTDTPTAYEVNSTNRINSRLAFGYVNTQETMQDLPDFKIAQNEVNALYKRYEDEMKSMQEKLEKKVAAFEKEENRLSANAKAQRQQELSDLYQQIHQTYQDNQQHLNEFSQGKMKIVQARILSAIHEVGENNNFMYIVENNSLPFINTSLASDLTPMVKNKLSIGGMNYYNPVKAATYKIAYIDTQDILSFFNVTDSIKLKQVQQKILDATGVVGIKNQILFIIEKNSLPFMNNKYLSDVTSLVKAELNISSVVSSNTIVSIDNANFGYVDTKRIMEFMPEYKEAQLEVNKLKERYEIELKRMQDDLQAKSELFDREQESLSNTKRQLRQQELENLYVSIQEAYLKNQQSLSDFHKTKMQAIQEKILSTIKYIGVSGEYAIIMENESMPFINTSCSDDVTDKVKAKLGL